MAFKASTMTPRLFANSATIVSMASCGPLMASTAAHWLMDDGLEVDWLWMLVMAFMMFLGPAA